jgi:hypothetical protein
MKLFKRTFHQRETELEFNRFGGRFGFWETLKKGGSGSVRMHYVRGAITEQIGMGGHRLLPLVNLEVRPEALIIHVNCYNENQYSWCMYNTEIARVEWIENPHFDVHEGHHDFSKNAAIRIFGTDGVVLCELAVGHIYKKAVLRFLKNWFLDNRGFVFFIQ